MDFNWRFITNFGDTIVIIPCMLLFLFWLILNKKTRNTACYICLAFFILAFITAITKILFQAFGIGSKTLNFTGVSGHSMLSAFFWPFFLYYSVSVNGIRSNVMFFIGIGFSVVISYGLLATLSHSFSEVAVGLTLGWATACFLIRKWRLLHPIPLVLTFFLIFVGVLIASMEVRAPTYQVFREISKYLSEDGKVQKRNLLYGSDIKS